MSTVAFSVSRDVYANIERAFDIDQAVIGYLTAEGAMISEIEAFDHGYGLLVALKRKHLIVTHNPASNKTYVMIGGFCHHEAENLTSILKLFQNETPTVTAVVVAWLLVVSQHRARSFLDNKEMMLSIEGKIGLHFAHRRDDETPLRSSLRVLTQELMLLNNAWDESANQFHLDLIEKLLGMRKTFVLESLASEPYPSPRLCLHLSQLRSLLTGLQLMRREIQQRADTARQTVRSYFFLKVQHTEHS